MLEIWNWGASNWGATAAPFAAVPWFASTTHGCKQRSRGTLILD
jgi:hypothetical protein